DGGTRHARILMLSRRGRALCAPVSDALRASGVGSYAGPGREIPVENTAPPIAIRQGRPAVLAKRYMVSSCHYLATSAGVRMFERGARALDAVVAGGMAFHVL